MTDSPTSASSPQGRPRTRQANSHPEEMEVSSERLQQALEREAAGTVTVDYANWDPGERRLLGPTGIPLVWVMSNRADNRAVGFWQDPNQPGGQVFLGPGVAQVARTAEIDALMMQGLLVETGEPERYMLHPDNGEPLVDLHGRRIPNPKYPSPQTADPSTQPVAQPGHPTPLGRPLDPDLFGDEQQKTIRERQGRLPREIAGPSGGIVPGLTHSVA